MTQLILKFFVYNKPRCEGETRTRMGTVGGAVGIAVNLLLAVGKALAGILFGSIALVADAVNNLTDAASSIITLVGFKLAAKKADSDHPYGHGRIEYISGLVMAFLVLLLGLSLGKSSIERVLHPVLPEVGWLSFAVMITAIGGKLWLSQFYKTLQKKTGSTAFGAAASDSRNDCISTLAVLISAVIFLLTDYNVDGIAGLLVSIFILVSGIGLIKETLDPLLGRPPEQELIDTIVTKTLSYDGILGIHDLVVHDYGPGRVFVTLHAEVDAKGNVLESHDLIDNIERDFKTDLNLETVIHLDPVVIDDPEINALKELCVRHLAKLEGGLTLHDFRAVKGPTHTNLIFDVVLPIGYEGCEKELKATIDGMLQNHRPDVFTVITFDRDYTVK